MAFSKEEIQQYSRHLLLDKIGEAGQEKLKNAKVLVIGAGGLGCPILQYLSAAGVGTIGIMDEDHVDISNLQRQVLFNHSDISKNKAVVAGQKLQSLNPHLLFRIYDYALNRDNALEIFKDFDIIVDGSDNFPTRYLVNDAAVICNKPLVFGSIFKFEGQVAVFNYKACATYRCLFPNPPQPGEVPNCSEIGVLGVLPGIIGCLQANEVLKIILEIGKPLAGKLLSFNALDLSQQIFNVSKNSSLKITELQNDYQSFCGLEPKNEQITFSELENLQTEHLLLDVRTKKEREIKSLGGIHIPLDEIESRWEELDPKKTLIVYCESGKRSEMAINILKEKLAQTQLYNLEGGIKAQEISVSS